MVPHAYLGVSTDGKIIFVEKKENDNTLQALKEKYNFSDVQIVNLGKKLS